MADLVVAGVFFSLKMKIIYFKYQPKNQFYAHVLEHCIHDILIRDYEAKITSAKTGLGSSEVAFEPKKSLTTIMAKSEPSLKAKGREARFSWNYRLVDFYSHIRHYAIKESKSTFKNEY